MSLIWWISYAALKQKAGESCFDKSVSPALISQLSIFHARIPPATAKTLPVLVTNPF